LVFRVVIFLCINLFIPCISLAANTSNYIVLDEINLPEELKETSGLYCPDIGSAYTINDSGNKPIIYNIDHTGRIIDKKLIATKNEDWEALTGDNNNFYIGDVGNNSGKRKFVQIHAVSKKDNNSDNINNDDNGDNSVRTSKVFYVNNSVKSNKYLKHDFDAESLINFDDSLVLFSKSWSTGTLFIYQLNKSEPQQFVEHISEIDGIPGVITGGDFDSKNNRFILVGYELKGMGSFYPFIVILNKDFSLNKSFKLLDYAQVEGMCVTPNGEIWFTQEGSFFSNHKIVKLNITK
jgi:hypothetical protein